MGAVFLPTGQPVLGGYFFGTMALPDGSTLTAAGGRPDAENGAADAFVAVLAP